MRMARAGSQAAAAGETAGLMMTEERKAAAPRKQHYVPQFYLRGLTNQNGQLFVVDATTRSRRRSGRRHRNGLRRRKKDGEGEKVQIPNSQGVSDQSRG